jgi:hypothetical protein
MSLDSIKTILATLWHGPFLIKEDSFDILIYVEKLEEDLNTNLWNHIPMKSENKDVLIYEVPLGYIDVFKRPRS